MPAQQRGKRDTAIPRMRATAYVNHAGIREVLGGDFSPFKFLPVKGDDFGDFAGALVIKALLQ